MGYYGYGMDPTIIILIPAMILAFWAQFKVSNTFKRYSNVENNQRITGAQAARKVLDSNGLEGVEIVPIAGSLTDHYNPANKTLNLSETVMNVDSVSAVSVACHEAGHAVQTAQGYGPIRLRTALVPVVSLTQQCWSLVFMAGVLLNMMGLVRVSIYLFAFSVLFHVVTLPVEINASRRAVSYLSQYGSDLDQQGARAVLTAAAMPYVAAALSSLLQLLYLIGRYNSSSRD